MGFTPVPANLDWQGAKNGGGPFITCLHKPVAACTVVHGTGRHVLLMGDSHAWMMIPAFSEIARRREPDPFGIRTWTDARGNAYLYVFPVTVNGTTLRTQDCRAQKGDTYTRVIPELHPDVIVVVQVAHEDPRAVPFLGPDGRPMQNGPAQVRWIESTTSQSLDVLREDGRKDPHHRADSASRRSTLSTCLSKAKVLEECRYVATTAPDPIEGFYRQIAKRDDHVVSADFDRLVCPFLPICDPVVNGQIVKTDGTHLTVAFAKVDLAAD